MLNVPAEFPWPGSIALFHGLRWKVQRHHNDGTALILRAPLPGQTASASLTRTAPVADLVDPADADRNAALSVAALTSADKAEADTRIALWLTRRLAHLNEISLGQINRETRKAALEGLIPLPRDNVHLSGLLRRLGWHKNGWTGTGWERSALYTRTDPAKATAGATGQAA